jgi:hypothetical protein
MERGGRKKGERDAVFQSRLPLSVDELILKNGGGEEATVILICPLSL